MPFVITFTPIMLLVGFFVFVALGVPILQASIQSIYLQTPVVAGGYGFTPLQNAFCKHHAVSNFVILFSR